MSSSEYVGGDSYLLVHPLSHELYVLLRVHAWAFLEGLVDDKALNNLEQPCLFRLSCSCCRFVCAVHIVSWHEVRRVLQRK